MASNAGNPNPDPSSKEGGGPAHNTTLDVLDGRLPGADHTSDKGQAIRKPGGDQLAETDSRNRENHRDACDAWVAEVLDRALVVRLQLVDQQTTLLTIQYAAAVGQKLLAAASPSNNNLSSNPPALGAEGAVSRAGFCGAASTGASHGASSAVRSASQPSGAEFCALLPAVDRLCLRWLRLPWLRRHRPRVIWLCLRRLCLSLAPPSVGSASVGSASVGSVSSASVGAASVGLPASIGSAAIGLASVGSASVGSGYRHRRS